MKLGKTEAAVLALGAIGQGCINSLYPHLSEVISSNIGKKEFNATSVCRLAKLKMPFKVVNSWVLISISNYTLSISCFLTVFS